MRARFISEFTEGMSVDGVFALRSKEVRLTRDGKPYLLVQLADRTGSIAGIVFDPSRSASDCPVNAPVRIKGQVLRFRGSKRVRISAIEPAREWDPAELLASSVRPLEELMAEFKSFAAGVENKSMRKVLQFAFGGGVLAQFGQHPGAISGRHACVGGLIEHTVSVARLCAGSIESHSGLDRDLLMGAALLHDIGRLDELAADTGVRLTDRGRLTGHEVPGAERVRAACACAGAEQSLALALEHAVLSHHHTGGCGEGVMPSTIEAVALSHADRLDAAISEFDGATSAAARAAESWTGADNRFGHALLVPHAPLAAESADSEAQRVKTRMTA